MDPTLIQILDEFTRCRSELLTLREEHEAMHTQNDEMLAAARSLDVSNQALRARVAELEAEKEAGWPQPKRAARKS